MGHVSGARNSYCNTQSTFKTRLYCCDHASATKYDGSCKTTLRFGPPYVFVVLTLKNSHDYPANHIRVHFGKGHIGRFVQHANGWLSGYRSLLFETFRELTNVESSESFHGFGDFLLCLCSLSRPRAFEICAKRRRRTRSCLWRTESRCHGQDTKRMGRW